MKTLQPIPSSPHAPPKWMWHYYKLQSLRDLLMADQASLQAKTACLRTPCNLDDASHPSENLHSHLFVGILSNQQASLTEVNSAIQQILDGTYDGGGMPRNTNGEN